MFDKRHFVVSDIYNPGPKMARFLHLKRIMDQKCAANLRLLATKNNINRASDYHYLNLAVTQSTEPVNGIDYIHPVLKPGVDYSTAVIFDEPLTSAYAGSGNASHTHQASEAIELIYLVDAICILLEIGKLIEYQKKIFVIESDLNKTRYKEIP